jgi:ubiquinone/menaquinone biosynthesis C-methylase UbiE
VDLLLAINVLDRVQDPRAAVQEWHRVVRPGGQLTVALPFDWLPETIGCPVDSIEKVVSSPGFHPTTEPEELMWLVSHPTNRRHIEMYAVQVQSFVREQ